MRSKNDNLNIAVIGLKGLPAFGGAANVGENIINQLKKEYNFTVFSVSSHAGSDYKNDNVEQYIFKTFFIKKLNVLFYYIKSCLYVLFNKRFDLIHLHHTDGAFILPLLRLRYKVIVTSHARPQEHEKWSKIVNFFFKINEKLTFSLANSITVVSKPLQDVYKRYYKRETLFIPNGIDLNLANIVSDKYNNKESYVLFAAGRIISSKGLHLLLEALRNLNYKGKLVVAGDTNQVKEYKQKINKLSKGLNVEFVGLIKEKKDLLSLIKNADYFIYPTLYEAMSIMLFEVALMKTPIICSDISANVAVFNDDDVVFFKSNDVDSLTSVLKNVFVDTNAFKDRIEHTYNTLKNNYEWNKIAKDYSNLYNSYK